MSGKERRRILAATIFAGLILILMVMLTAYAAELRTENNQMIAENEDVATEIDNLNVEIKAASSIEHIEEVATKKLGMIPADVEKYVMVTDADTPEENFTAVIRKEAYN